MLMICYSCQDEAHNNELAILLSFSCDDLEEDDNAAGFLGVRIEQKDSVWLEVKQKELIDHVIEALGLDDGTMIGKTTLAEAKLLEKYKDGEVAHSDFSYSMLWA